MAVAGAPSQAASTEAYVNFGQLPFSYATNNGDGTVDVPNVGTCKTLMQPWATWVAAATFKLLEASEYRVDTLEQVLRNIAITHESQSQYPIYSIVNIGGNLYEAVVDDADPSDLTTDWEALNIEVE